MRGAILVYGSQKKKEIREKTTLSVIDVTEPDILDDLPTDAKYFCLGPTLVIARRKLPSESLVPINSLSDLPLAEERDENGETPAAARIGEIVVSNAHHPAVERAGAWLSSYHIGLIDKILGEGLIIEILDQRNKVIRTLGDK